MAAFPDWLVLAARISLILAAVCAVVIALDEVRRPQPMAVMNIVWPVTALFGSLLWLWFYFRWGRGGDEHPDASAIVATAKASSHCGAGCTLGDIAAEWLVFAVPGLAVVFGYGTLFGEPTFAVWVLDFLAAFALGIAFQYFTIAPMHDGGPGDALKQALKADAASIAAWQIGMYSLMAVIQFGWLRPAYGRLAPADSAVFWFAMQAAMLAGFVTSLPVNAWLIRSGTKEAM